MNDEKTAMILLVGEQPAPNLLPVQHLKPKVVGIVSTSRTLGIAKNLEAVLNPGIICHHCTVDAYQLTMIQKALNSFIADTLGGYDLCFNLTGGTKPMALAAFQIAGVGGHPFFYLQSEGGVSKLFHYGFSSDADRTLLAQGIDVIADTLTLDQYLRMYLTQYTTEKPREVFEEQVHEILVSMPGVDEVFTGLRPQGMGALEVDFVIRCGNQIGVGEVKSKASKKAIDQLNGVAQRQYLGTYVRKFLISGHEVDSNNKELAKAYRTELVELLSYGEMGRISPQDAEILSCTIQKAMGIQP